MCLMQPNVVSFNLTHTIYFILNQYVDFFSQCGKRPTGVLYTVFWKVAGKKWWCYCMLLCYIPLRQFGNQKQSYHLITLALAWKCSFYLHTFVCFPISILLRNILTMLLYTVSLYLVFIKAAEPQRILCLLPSVLSSFCKSPDTHFWYLILHRLMLFLKQQSNFIRLGTGTVLALNGWMLTPQWMDVNPLVEGW